MVITYHGAGHFKIQSGDFTVAVDPTRRIKADIIIRLNSEKGEKDDEAEGFLISHPGEYEVKETRVSGRANIYIIEMEDMRVVLAGQHAENTGEISSPDVLIAPADSKTAELGRQLKPSILAVSAENKDIKSFLKELGREAETLDKLTFKKKDLTPEAMKAVVLKA